MQKSLEHLGLVRALKKSSNWGCIHFHIWIKLWWCHSNNGLMSFAYHSINALPILKIKKPTHPESITQSVDIYHGK